MKTMTIEQQIIEAGKKATSTKEIEEIADRYTEEILQTDERLYAINRKRVGYGTWKHQLWTNDVHFGKMLSESLSHYKITHDEDKTYTIEDFREEIHGEVFEIAYTAMDGGFDE